MHAQIKHSARCFKPCRLCSRCQLHHVPLAIDFLMYSASHGIQKPCRPGEGPNGAGSEPLHRGAKDQTLVTDADDFFFLTAQSNSLHHLQLFPRQFRTRNGGVVESQTLDISRIRQGSLCCRQNFIVIHLEPTRDRLLDELDDFIRYRSKHCAEKRHHASSCTKERKKN